MGTFLALKSLLLGLIVLISINSAWSDDLKSCSFKIDGDLSEWHWYQSPTSNDLCYGVQNKYDAGESFELAKYVCEEADGTLLSIHDKAMNDFIVNIINNQTETSGSIVWLGLRWLPHSHTLEWTDNSPIDFTYFGPKLSDKDQSRKACNILDPKDTGDWRDYDCMPQVPAPAPRSICQKLRPGFTPSKPTTPPPSNPNANCESGWAQYKNSKCLKVKSKLKQH